VMLKETRPIGGFWGNSLKNPYGERESDRKERRLRPGITRFRDLSKAHRFKKVLHTHGGGGRILRCSRTSKARENALLPDIRGGGVERQNTRGDATYKKQRSLLLDPLWVEGRSPDLSMSLPVSRGKCSNTQGKGYSAALSWSARRGLQGIKNATRISDHCSFWVAREG